MIDILLATYNGEKYLSEQLSSILSQTEEGWRIIVRDDGSSDSTHSVLETFAAEHPGKLLIVKDGDRNLGCIKNFSRLMSLSDADYSMFCDQDDIWLPDKLERTLKKMHELELTGLPVLVHTELSVANSAGEVISQRFAATRAYPAEPDTAAALFFGNSVTGCTVMINRALRILAGELPLGCTMHDHYLALLALSFGRLGFVDEPAMLYRQHGSNVCGAGHKSIGDRLKRLLDPHGFSRALDRTEKELDKNLAQVRSIYEGFSGQMDGHTRDAYRTVLEIKGLPRSRRVGALKKIGCLPSSRYERTAVKTYYFFRK